MKFCIGGIKIIYYICDMELWNKAHIELYNSKEGDSWGDIKVVKRTPKKIYLESGLVITIKNSKFGFNYLSSKSLKRGNRSYPMVDQILRDIEGYLLYKIHANNEIQTNINI